MSDTSGGAGPVKPWNSILVGVGWTLLPALGLGVLAGAQYAGLLPGADSFIGMATLVGGAAIGLTQLAWVVPGLVWVAVTGRNKTLAGLLVSSAVVLLLNGACFGYVVTTMNVH